MTQEVAMAVDGQGLDVTGSAEGVAAYDRAIGHLLRFRPEVVDAAAEAAAEGSVLGAVLGAYLGLMSTEEGSVAAASGALGRYAAADCDDSALTARERAHLTAARRWIGGDMAGAGYPLSARSLQDPRGPPSPFRRDPIRFF